MVKDGLLMSRFAGERVCGIHNYPGQAARPGAIRPGSMMAAADDVGIATIEGKGGHAARPHLAIDTVLIGT